MYNKCLAAAAAALACLAGTAGAQSDAYRFNWTPAGTVTPTPPAMDFLMIAGASDLYEIESSRAVMETTTNSGIRAFAQMMVQHHTKTSQDAMAAARRAGLTPPPSMLTQPQVAMIASLRMFQGVERDRLYLTQQMMAHKEARGVMKTYSETGDTPELKAAATASIPIIERHLAEVERLSR